ncbi:MAG: paraslipin [Spirochaetales bacterium]|nr:paraslipin [Spirochaetales bacterium]
MNALIPLYVIGGLFALIVFIALLRSIRIVTTQSALIVERLGKYSKTLEAGFHLLVPFIDKVRYKHNLKEQAVDVPAQDCFTQDNVKVRVDGVLYLQVVDPKRASYGIKDYKYATIQLAQTTMRSVIGKLELDRTFEERQNINAEVVKSVDDASDPWGVNVSRYEIQNISVPDTILQAMEVQMKAEREKRAAISRSIGTMESRINYSQATMEEAINKSEGEKEKRINEAEGRAAEILAVAKATAAGISKVAEAINEAGGEDAVAMRIAEGYIDELKKLAREDTKLVLPIDMSSIESVMETVRGMLKA